MIAGFVRGLSTRDVEATLAEALGPQAALSRSTVSRICAQLAEEFTAWSTRDPSSVELDYLYLDATSFRYHPVRGPNPSWSPMASPGGQPGLPRAGPAGSEVTTPGPTSSATWWIVGWEHQCWW